MKIEHIGYPAQDPPAVAKWYGEHLGFRVARGQAEPPYTHFLVDAAGQGVIEIYNNPLAPVPDYPRQHPLLLHVAMDVEDEDLAAAARRLIAAGATVAEELKVTPAGDRLIILRDPWGFPLQLAKRTAPLR